MDFRDLTITDQKIFNSYLKKYPPNVSEMTFTNLYAWKNNRRHRFMEENGHLLIISEEQKMLFQPIGPDPAGMIRKTLPLLPDYHAGRVEENIAKAAGGDITETEDMHDYVYDLESLRTLEGQKFRAKRNFINRFKKNNPKVLPITEQLIPECLRIHEEWCRIKNCREDAMLAQEDDAIRSVMNNYLKLGFMGIIVFIQNKAVAFAFAERLNDDTYVDHFEKADISYPGAYQYLNMELAKEISSSIKYLNREQDLGIPGLRKAKKSYNPSHIIKKFSIRIQHHSRKESEDEIHPPEQAYAKTYA